MHLKRSDMCEKRKTIEPLMF